MSMVFSHGLSSGSPPCPSGNLTRLAGAPSSPTECPQPGDLVRGVTILPMVVQEEERSRDSGRRTWWVSLLASTEWGWVPIRKNGPTIPISALASQHLFFTLILPLKDPRETSMCPDHV
uniref:Uncharacterized protein n=1 Tax=Micrurus surinamensis TaxID=129470 RepID=A0A2D4P3F9_MICSU